MRRFYLFLFFVVLLASCTGRKVYDHYEHTTLSGWDRVDELDYNIPALKDSGRYVTTLGLRISEVYPFQSLTLKVKQRIYHKTKGKAGKPKTYTYTINCSLFDSKGRIKGNGISYYQYHYHVSEAELQQGDSIHISVSHDMRREIMPGISDIGISLTKQR